MTPLSHNPIRKVHPLVAATLILSTLPISFAVSTFAQEKDAVDQQTGQPATYYGDGWLASWCLLQQLEVNSKKYAEAVKNNDAAAVATLFTEDAVFVTPDAGAVYGREGVEELFAEWFKGSHCNDHISMRYPNSVRIVGMADNIASSGEWSETWQSPGQKPIQFKSYWSAINTREGGDWKIRMLTVNTTPAPATTTASAEKK